MVLFYRVPVPIQGQMEQTENKRVGQPNFSLGSMKKKNNTVHQILKTKGPSKNE